MDNVRGGIDRHAARAIAIAVAAAVVAAPTTAAGVSPTPSAPAATSRPAPTSPSARSGVSGGRAVDGRRDPAAGIGVVVPSGESNDVTRLLLLLLAGFFVLILVPTQLAKGIAQRRARDAAPPKPLRRPGRGP